VIVIGLTGGIGSGKSAAARVLADLGAEPIDADQVAREVVQPGGPAHARLRERFGPGFFSPGGELDRPALARLVFTDPAALAELNAITHPAIRSAIAERLARLRARPSPPAAVVVEIPLVGPGTKAELGMDVLIVVDTATEVALERLTAQRGMSAEDARARMSNQLDRDARRRLADVVIANDGSTEELAERVRRVWGSIVTAPR
jgi:dephospho-CoA kinase